VTRTSIFCMVIGSARYAYPSMCEVLPYVNAPAGRPLDTIGPADAELKEDRLKDDRVHGLSMPGTHNKIDRGCDMEEKAARANFMTLKDCLGLLISILIE
nr:plant cysteine oxidase 3-like [Tanacetum cinerariifolium]